MAIRSVTQRLPSSGRYTLSAWSARNVDPMHAFSSESRIPSLTPAKAPIVRSTEIHIARPNTCHKWAEKAGAQIATLPKEYWDNADYKIEQVVWNVTPRAYNVDHCTLRITFKQTGVIAIWTGRNRSSTDVNGGLAGRSCCSRQRCRFECIAVRVHALRFFLEAVFHKLFPLIAQVNTTQIKH